MVSNGTTVSTIRTSFLPFKSVIFLNETTLLAAGYDFYPVVFIATGDGWKLGGKLNERSAASSPTTGRSSGTLASSAAFNKFKQMDSKGQKTSSKDLQTGVPAHQNCIVEARAFETKGTSVAKVSTVGLDGNLTLWDMLESRIAELKI